MSAPNGPVGGQSSARATRTRTRSSRALHGPAGPARSGRTRPPSCPTTQSISSSLHLADWILHDDLQPFGIQRAITAESRHALHPWLRVAHASGLLRPVHDDHDSSRIDPGWGHRQPPAVRRRPPPDLQTDEALVAHSIAPHLKASGVREPASERQPPGRWAPHPRGHGLCRPRPHEVDEPGHVVVCAWREPEPFRVCAPMWLRDGDGVGDLAR